MRIKQNVGQTDRLLRTILGIYAMLFGFLFAQGIIGAIIGVIGLAAFITGLVGWCGIYAILGKSTVEEQADTTVSTDGAAQEE